MKPTYTATPYPLRPEAVDVGHNDLAPELGTSWPARTDRRSSLAVTASGRAVQWQLSTQAFQHFSSTRNENGARKRRKSLIFLVGGAGFEPATPAV